MIWPNSSSQRSLTLYRSLVNGFLQPLTRTLILLSWRWLFMSSRRSTRREECIDTVINSAQTSSLNSRKTTTMGLMMTRSNTHPSYSCSSCQDLSGWRIECYLSTLIPSIEKLSEECWSISPTKMSTSLIWSSLHATDSWLTSWRTMLSSISRIPCMILIISRTIKMARLTSLSSSTSMLKMKTKSENFTDLGTLQKRWHPSRTKRKSRRWSNTSQSWRRR